jgi:hypothetical protein
MSPVKRLWIWVVAPWDVSETDGERGEAIDRLDPFG